MMMNEVIPILVEKYDLLNTPGPTPAKKKRSRRFKLIIHILKERPAARPGVRITALQVLTACHGNLDVMARL